MHYIRLAQSVNPTREDFELKTLFLKLWVERLGKELAEGNEFWRGTNKEGYRATLVPSVGGSFFVTIRISQASDKK